MLRRSTEKKTRENTRGIARSESGEKRERNKSQFLGVWLGIRHCERRVYVFFSWVLREIRGVWVCCSDFLKLSFKDVEPVPGFEQLQCRSCPVNSRGCCVAEASRVV